MEGKGTFLCNNNNNGMESKVVKVKMSSIDQSKVL